MFSPKKVDDFRVREREEKGTTYSVPEFPDIDGIVTNSSVGWIITMDFHSCETKESSILKILSWLLRGQLKFVSVNALCKTIKDFGNWGPSTFGYAG